MEEINEEIRKIEQISPDDRTLKILEKLVALYKEKVKIKNPEAIESQRKYENFECLKTFTGHKEIVWCVVESQDGKTIISGSGDKTIKIWDKETGKCLKTLEGHRGWIFSLVESRDGKTIISGSNDGTIKIWDKETGKCIKTLDVGSAVVSLAESHDRKTIISDSADGAIKIWGEKVKAETEC